MLSGQQIAKLIQLMLKFTADYEKEHGKIELSEREKKVGAANGEPHFNQRYTIIITFLFSHSHSIVAGGLLT